MTEKQTWLLIGVAVLFAVLLNRRKTVEQAASRSAVASAAALSGLASLADGLRASQTSSTPNDLGAIVEKAKQDRNAKGRASAKAVNDKLASFGAL